MKYLNDKCGTHRVPGGKLGPEVQCLYMYDIDKQYMYMYMYVYVYTFVHVYVHVCTFVHVYNTCMYTCTLCQCHTLICGSVEFLGELPSAV